MKLCQGVSMNKNNYKLECLKLINNMDILKVQKKEMIDFLNEDLSSNPIDHEIPPKDKVKTISQAFGKNNYKSYILISSIMNFLIANFLYLGITIFNHPNLKNIPINGFIEISIIILTLIIYPSLKLIIRKGLLNKWKGITILKKVLIIIVSLFLVNMILYQVANLNRAIINIPSIPSLPIMIILIIIFQIILRSYKYDPLK